MTEEEATKVVKIMLTADSWCSNCQGGLMEQFQKAFPEHVKIANDIWERATSLEAAHKHARDDWEDKGWKGEPPDVWEVHVY